ncbi:MAG: hypothetical protein GYA43_08050 [Bacteroidales bacterium]|nr:hypothetical protein [Bacteroidales bacterium]
MCLKAKKRNISRAFAAFVSTCLVFCNSCSDRGFSIDRYALVNRHNIEIKSIDSLNSLTVGNGRFAFTVDITGLQTLHEYHSNGIPLGTMADWGWHSSLNKGRYSQELVFKTWDVHGRKIDYVHRYTDRRDTLRYLASEWMRENPHKIHLGMIGLDFQGAGNTLKSLIENPVQKLDLWRGMIESRFMVSGNEVTVSTVCHPQLDMVSSSVASSLLKDGKLRIRIHFPKGIPGQTAYDFSKPDGHTTEIVSQNDTAVVFIRRQDEDVYYVKLYKPGLKLVKGEEEHLWYLVAPPGDSVLRFSCLFTREMPDGSPLPDFIATELASADFWKDFWSTGGAVDFSGCTDPRAAELERRVILSRYLTRIQCAGDNPPAETGLTYNTWYGKFHLEMHWWHGVHFVLWQKEEILENQMQYYFRIIDKALATARHQGYKGVRWPKMTDPEGKESPSNVGPYLIWQQPHFICFAELLYQNAKDKKSVLEKYKDLVFATADFMASYAWYDTALNRYILGPALISAQESLRPETTVNPTFELVYWYWGLKTAQLWRKRLAMKPDPLYADVIRKLSPPAVKDGLYLCSEDTRDTWENPRYMSDHPIIAGIAGMIPQTPLVDKNILRNTLDTIGKVWNWNTSWGWDFPLLAMSAAAVGESGKAIDFLLMDAPKNRYLPNGHNFQDAQRLMIYLPGNGGLLAAVANMCTTNTFPDNGRWKVKWENLNSIK